MGDTDRPTVAWLMMELWGSTKQVVHGTVFHPADLPGLIAERERRLAGLLTYNVSGGVMEIVTLNALERRAGVGTLLMEAAAVDARRHRCTEIRLTTTNDNLDALRFYQRRGLRLVALRPGAVDRARAEKPAIPRIGDYGIPLHDEIDLARRVLSKASAVATKTVHASPCVTNAIEKAPAFRAAFKIFGAASRRAHLTRPRREGPSWGNSCGPSYPSWTCTS